MKEQEDLVRLEKEKAEFLKENKSVFAKIEEYDKKIDELQLAISNNLIKNIPELISSLTGDDVNFLYDLEYDIDDEELLNELREEVELSETKYEKYRQRELDLVLSLKGWKIETYDEGHEAVNDGDYFDISFTLISPEGVRYTTNDETCLAVYPNFPDDLYWNASL